MITVTMLCTHMVLLISCYYYDKFRPSNTSPQEIKLVWGRYIRILYNPDRLLRVGRADDDISIMNFDGEVVQTVNGEHIPRSLTLLDNSRIVSGDRDDNTVQICDITTGETLYKFRHHSVLSQFTCFAFHKLTETLFCGNENGKLYVLKTTPNCSGME